MGLRLLCAFCLYLLGLSAPVCADQLTEITLKLGPPSFTRAFEYTPGPADQPEFFKSWTYRDKLYGYLFYKIDDNSGDLKVRLRVTNGHKYRGFTVCASIVFRDDQSSKVLASSFKWGVNPRKDRDETRNFKVDPQIWKLMKAVDVYWTRCSSNRFIADLILRGMAFVGGEVIKSGAQ